MDKESTLIVEDYTQNYSRQWLILAAVVISIGLFYGIKTHIYRTRPVPLPATEAPKATWFYVLRMPEMQIHSDIGSSRDQFSKWIQTLQLNDFHFMLLSDVVRQLSQGAALPEKTAVIVFDPGYWQTADTYVPLLKKLAVPAVWMTDGKALEQNDKRFISQHLAQTMEASGLWDIGLYTPEAPMTLRAHGHETVLLGHHLPWKPSAGRYAVNLGISDGAFERLNISPKWTEQDLLHRLLVERPLRAPSLLSMEPIQGRDWGIGLDAAAPREDRFTLRAPSTKRSASLYWLGTQGVNDVHLRVEVKSLVGEMRLFLRSDLTSGNSLSIIFGRGRVAVDQDQNFKTERLTSVTCPDIAPQIPFTAALALMGRQLVLTVNNHPVIALDSIAEATSTSGMVRLMIQDSLKGVGEARSVRMIFTPLQKEK